MPNPEGLLLGGVSSSSWAVSPFPLSRPETHGTHAGQTLIASVVAWFLLGTPNEVRWLNRREKVMANARILKNNAGTDLTGKKHWNWGQFKETFYDPALYFQFVNTFLITVVCGLSRNSQSMTCFQMNGALTTFGTVVCKPSRQVLYR